MQLTAVELKELGNGAIKEGKYEEAVLRYSEAIKLEPSNFSLFSNRSYAFLKIKQFYHAMEDAKETIRLNSSWAKVSARNKSLLVNLIIIKVILLILIEFY